MTKPNPDEPRGRAPRGYSRRALLKRLGALLITLPALKLSETMARGERRRRNHRGADPDSFWIGHC